MYKLLIVEDEALSKLALQTAINATNSNFQIVASASNGAEALAIIKAETIDAIITDLKMPVMDGLELIKQLKAINFTGPILVLSNYADFDYVRTALTIGAYDYLLKINLDSLSLRKELEKMADILANQQKQLAAENGKIASAAKASKAKLLANCSQWLNNLKADDLASDLVSELLAEITFPVYLFTLSTSEQNNVAISVISDIVSNTFSELEEKLIFQSKSKSLCTLISSPSLAKSGRSLQKKLARCQREIETYFQCPSKIVYYEKAIDFSELHAAYQLCLLFANQSYYTQEKIIQAHSLSRNPLNYHTVQTNFFKAMCLAKEKKDAVAMQNALQNFFATCADLLISAKELSTCCFLLLERMDIAQAYTVETQQLLETQPSARALAEQLLNILQTETVDYEFNKTKFRKEVNAVIKYVNANYQQKLSLDQIANHVNLNREYLSRLFSKETGQSLFQHINAVRMEAAADLIRSQSDIYIKEVAAKVGFDDPYFFSRRFKEYFGKSPSEFAER